MGTEAKERARDRLVEEMQVLDTAPDPSFDAVTQLAASICGKETALITLISGQRQWFKSRYEIDLTETTRADSFCTHAIDTDLVTEILEVPDTHLDPRFRDNPYVCGAPHFRFYAGVPLRPTGDVAVGTLCVLDSNPSELTNSERTSLRRLGGIAEELLRLHLLASTEAELLGRVERSEQYYRYLADHTADVVFVHGSDLVRRYYSPNMPAFFGYTAAEVDALGPEHHFLSPDDITVLNGENGFSEDEPTMTIRGRGLCKGGRRLDVSVDILAVYENHEIVEYRSSVRDISATVAYESKLHEANAELREAVTQRAHAVRSIAHDLASPLAAIRLTTESVCEQLIPSPVRTQVEYLVEFARHAEALIGDLRLVNSPDGADQTMRWSCQNLRPIIERAAQQVVGDIRLDLVQLDLIDMMVGVDEHAVSRMVTNLLTNSLRHNPQGTRVWVTLRRSEEFAVLVVEDDGVGIPESERLRMLEPYEALTPGGSGLGLAITKALVEAHDGEFTIGGRFPSGTVVMIELPLEQPNCPDCPA